MKYPKVLVISNNSFSLSNSNGRTLGLLFKGWPKDKLAQFCITTDGPDWDICDYYFCVSDRQVLKSTLTFKAVKRNNLKEYQGMNVIPKTKRIKRTPIKSLIRHLLWDLGIWKMGDFNKWVAEFSPEIVLIQSGDTAFTHDLARRISDRFNSILVFFNTEGIYFMKKQYLYKGVFDNLFFPIYHYIYKNSYKRAMQRASYAFYLNDLIKRDNDLAFNVPGEVIYNTSELTPTPFVFNQTSPTISYFGNFGYHRYMVLIEVANTLKSLDIDIKFNVYGKGFPEAEDMLKECEAINFYGFVSYDRIKDIIGSSDILLHVESPDKQFHEVLKYGFSTKIADCLSSGRPFLLYSSPNIACAQYIINNQCAWFAHNSEEIKEAIQSIVFDPEVRSKTLDKAMQVAKCNHSLEGNSKRFQRRLSSL